MFLLVALQARGDTTPCSIVHFTAVSEENSVSIFRIKEKAEPATRKQQVERCCLFDPGSFIVLHLNLEAWSNMFLRNFGILLPDYTASHPSEYSYGLQTGWPDFNSRQGKCSSLFHSGQSASPAHPAS
jgi:hypothetical protein